MTQDSPSQNKYIDRRGILRLAAIGGGTAIAGCGSDNSGDTPEETQSEADPTDSVDEGTDTPGGSAETETDTDTETATPEFTPKELVYVEGGGNGFSGTSDEGHYFYQEVSGDFDVAVHCAGLGATRPELETRAETAGIMVRSSLEPQAPMAMVRRRPHEDPVNAPSAAWGTWRPEASAETQAVDGPPAEWLRLRRQGETLTIFGSMTGEDWTQLSEFAVPDDVALGDEVYVGLAVTSVETDGAQTASATFTELSGLSPAESTDLGEPDNEGRSIVREDVPYVTTLEPDHSAGETTLRGSLYLPPEFDAADCHFQYRQYGADDWQTTDGQSLERSETVTATVSVDPRRIYLLRVVADVPDAPDLPAADLTTGTVAVRGTPSSVPDDEHEDPSTPLSADVSEIGMADGFAEPAPWLDDDTPVIVIDELSREALDEAFRAPHERVIVFEAGGIVDLQGEQLSIRTDKCYVAGQTAPSPGVTFINGGLQIAADDCVLQHLRVRPGDYRGEDGWAPTSLQTQDTRQNNVVDHCTTTWGIDENLTIGGGTSNTTYTNNLVAEPLHDSTHTKGKHGYGSLINPEAKNVALLGNVWTRNVDRNPRLRLASTNVVANNLTYHYSDGCWMDPQTRASIVGNQYLDPVSDQPNIMTKSLDYGEGIPKAYVADNYCDGDVPMVGEDVEELDERPLWPEGFEAMAVDDVYDHNLANVGARPADRTPHDERILQHIRDGTGDFIDSQSEVGGYPDLETTTHDLEVPQTGTRSWLREQSRRVEDPTA